MPSMKNGPNPSLRIGAWLLDDGTVDDVPGYDIEAEITKLLGDGPLEANVTPEVDSVVSGAQSSLSNLLDEVGRLLGEVNKLGTEILKERAESGRLQKHLNEALQALNSQKELNRKLRKELTRTPTQENAILLDLNKNLQQHNADLRQEMVRLQDDLKKRYADLEKEATKVRELPLQARNYLRGLQSLLTAIPEVTTEDLSHLTGRDHQLAEDIRTATSGKKAARSKPAAATARHQGLEID